MARETTEGTKLQKGNNKQDFRDEEISSNCWDHLHASLISWANECVAKIDVGMTFRPCLEIIHTRGALMVRVAVGGLC